MTRLQATRLTGVLIACGLPSLPLCSAAAAQVSYALVIGNNAPPVGEKDLTALRYADDDAVRFYQFFSRFTSRTLLLTVLDDDTQKRYPDLGTHTRLPSRGEVDRAVEELAAAMESDRRNGDSPVFYLTFSGHGAVNRRGRAYLALQDGRLTRRALFKELLEQLPADYHHLLVDACHAGGVVGARGVKEAQAVRVTSTERERLAAYADNTRAPELGFVISATADQKTHEWSRFQSGVFTHELLSGLAGPADVNRDGSIEYSEIHAFVAAANRDVRDPRAIPEVIARAPTRNRRVPLVRLDQLQGSAVLRGDPSSLGHFHIELANGQRYLDANLSDASEVSIAIPAETVAFLRTRDREARLNPKPADRLDLALLELGARSVASRGSTDLAFRTALFRSPFGQEYYRGFVDRIDGTSVRFVEEHEATVAQPGWPRAAWAAAAVALAAGVASLTTGGFAIDAWVDYKGTNVQRTAHEAHASFERLSQVSVASAVVAGSSALLAWLLWPETVEPADDATASIQLNMGADIAASFRW